MTVQDLTNRQVSELQAILARVDDIENRAEFELLGMVSQNERDLIVLARLLLQVAPALAALSPDNL